MPELQERHGQKRPDPPAKESTLRQGTGGVGIMGNPKQGEKDWAKISPRERDRILQSMSEGFPPEYRLVLERYYRRLAEEKTVAREPIARRQTPRRRQPTARASERVLTGPR